MTTRVTKNNFIVGLTQIKKGNPVGNKALNLAFMARKGYNVPKTLVCIFDAYHSFQNDEKTILEHLEEELTLHIHEGKKYSVRSSANIEDATSYSFAGQFYTQLNVVGVQNIIEAIKSVWRSVKSVNELDYIRTVNNRQPIQMGVIVQEMVYPIYSGVVFTKNPMTGLDEVVVESVDGFGDALVQEGMTPDRWVYKWGDWIEKPKQREERLSIVLKVITQSRELAKLYGAPLDLEWCYDGEKIHWLQLRAITALDSTKLFSNRISREFLPGLIKPLVWSVNIPVINSSWKKLFKEAIGSAADSIDIRKLSKQFYYRAYFNMGIIGDIFEILGMPREALEILAGIESAGEERPMFKPSRRTFVHLPRMILTALRKLMFSKAIEKFIRDYRVHYNRINSVDLESLSVQETINHIEELFELNKHGSYMVIVSMLLNNLYNMLLQRVLSGADIDTENLQLAPNSNRLRETDPRVMLTQLHDVYAELPADKKRLIDASTNDRLPSEIMTTEFGHLLIKFIERFGHLSDSGNDFSRSSWRDTPLVILELIKRGPGQISGASSLNNNVLKSVLNQKGLNKTIYRKAMRYQEYRELVNRLYTFGYSQFRRFFLHLATLLNNSNMIAEREDIFYLKYPEILRLINGELERREATTGIEQRKQEMDEFADLVLPEIIFGDAPPLKVDRQRIGMELNGVGTSGGHYTGPAKIVRGVGDFGKIEKGDVLVIPYSDVSWTPLFSIANAVISESGGLLSHCSIVAREYGIPAVVSVEAATQLEDGTLLTVDGNNGLVFVLDTKGKG